MGKPVQYEAFLKLETGSHTARIRQLRVTPDGKSLITSGEDKTIRIWDSDARKQTGMLLGNIGSGEDGMIQAMAISRDGKYLVALIWLDPQGTHAAHDRETDVRVFELATGNLQARRRYPGTLQDLDFSPDGKYIAMVGNPNEPIRCGYVYIYDSKKILQGFGKVPSPTKGAVDVLYDNDTLIPSYVRFVPEEPGKSTDYRIVAAPWNHNKGGYPEYTGKLFSFSYSSKGLKKLFECETEESVAPDSLAVSRDFIVITGDVNKVFCYNHEGKLIGTIPWETVPAQPVFSKDGSQLIVGQRDDSALVQVRVYNTSFGKFQLRSTYYGHDAQTVAVGFLPDGTALSAGGDQNGIHFWSTAHLEGEQTALIVGVGQVVRAVGVSEQEQIGIGNHGNLRLEDGNTILQKMFDLRSMTLKPLSLIESQTFQRAQKKFGKQSLKKEGADLYLKPEYWQVRPGEWYDPITFGFTRKGTIISGAHDGKLRVFPRMGDGSYQYYERFLVGHTARLLDHAASSKWLVTGGKDQVIRLWYLEDVDQDVTTDLEPALNLFVGTDDEWVIWSKSGYYNASQRGDRRFGYHISRGADKEALFFSSDRFIKTFFRPDIIQAIIEYGSEEKALEKLAEQGIRVSPIIVSEILPPIVELEENGIVATKNDVRFTFTTDSLGKPVTRVWILQNDQFAWESREPKPSYTVTLPLRPGRNRFKILAENENAKSPPLIYVVETPEMPKGGTPLDGDITTRGTAEAARSQSNITLETKLPDNGVLFLLAVGVSKLEMEKGGFKSLQYAHTDAISIYNAFARSKLSGPLDKTGALKNKAFQSIEATILLNEEATKAAILQAVDRIGEKIKERATKNAAQRDVFFVFLSGHGIRRSDAIERELYFWNYDLDRDQTRATGLSFIELGQKITALPADIIIATDACHSGMAGSDVVRGLDPNELAKQMYAINERGMYILNAARSEQLAIEAQALQHGVFTRSILETLQYQGSEISMLSLIASVQERVDYYTRGTQSSVCRMYGDLLPLVVYKK